MAEHSGAEGKIFLSLPLGVGETVDDAVYVELCVTDWSHTPTQKTVPSTTTCDWDEVDQVTYEDESVVTRGCEFEATAFYEGDEAPGIDAILESKYTGPIALKRFTGKYLTADASVIKSIAYAGTTDNLQTVKISGKVKGKYVLNAPEPANIP